MKSREIMTINRDKAEGKVHGLWSLENHWRRKEQEEVSSVQILRTLPGFLFLFFCPNLSHSHWIETWKTRPPSPPPHSRSCYCRFYLHIYFYSYSALFEGCSVVSEIHSDILFSRSFDCRVSVCVCDLLHFMKARKKRNKMFKDWTFKPHRGAISGATRCCLKIESW